MSGLLAAIVLAAGPHTLTPAECRQPLDLVYDGHLEEGLQASAARREAHPDDPLVAYVDALAFVWRVEQLPATTTFDRELERRVAHAVALSDAQLKASPTDIRARLARAGAWGVSSRYHMFRLHKSEAARDAARMRADLLAVRARDPENAEALFGLGLYDYYADVLPRLMKLLRIFTRIPGGDRERGLAALEQARAEVVLHRTEVQLQLYEIYAWYEKQPDRALAEIRELARRHPGWPLWSLKLAEHLRDRLGLYGESAWVARRLMEEEERRPPAERGAAAVLARVSLGESLVADLRLDEARRTLLSARDGGAAGPAIGQRARLLLGHALELEGDRDAARGHYERSAQGPDRDLRKRAQDALSHPLPAEHVRGSHLIAEARRARERGRAAQAAEAYRQALRVWPRSQEAALRVAEDDLDHGRGAAARSLVDDLVRERAPEPPWVRPWSWLLRAEALDLEGEREAALEAYRKVLAEPHGQDELRGRAAEGLRRPFVPTEPPPPSIVR
jgi:tetratricopeptide (TPR) repeat protein